MRYFFLLVLKVREGDHNTCYLVEGGVQNDEHCFTKLMHDDRLWLFCQAYNRNCPLIQSHSVFFFLNLSACIDL